jgi:hypothetical protein
MNNFIAYIIGVLAGLSPGIITIWAIMDNKKQKKNGLISESNLEIGVKN